MRQYIHIAYAAAAIIALAGCQKDDPFAFNAGEGALNCESLTVDYVNSQNPSRATGVNIADFDVNFINTASGQTVRSFKYHQMPELVALPKGEYRVEASYGDNPVAEWEAPYYLGNSTFSIETNKITDNVDPVECKLSNMRISVKLDDMGLGILDDDAKVIVEAGKEGWLTYDKTTTGKSGYFRYVEGSTTITATFSGTVNGNFIESVSRTYDNASAGNHYSINFTVTTPDNVEPGDIEINGTLLRVDATVTVTNQNETINPGEPDPSTEDNMRPADGDDNKDTPDPTPDEPSDALPEVKAGEGGLTLGASNIAANLTACKFSVISHHEDGFTGFTVDIESPSLTPEELATVGLASHLDLIEPGDLAEPLSNLGFPVNIAGWKKADFDITAFLDLLAALGPGEHKFIIKVTDGNGTTEEWFSLVIQ